MFFSFLVRVLGDLNFSFKDTVNNLQIVKQLRNAKMQNCEYKYKISELTKFD
jgi:hypothetical protein